MADVAIRFKDVSKWFGKLKVLSDIDLAVVAGEVVVVCGPSGSGKSTLIRCVNGLEGIQGGDLVVLGESIVRPGVSMSGLRTRVGMVFQSFNLFPHMTVLQNITLAPVKVRGLGAAAGHGAQTLVAPLPGRIVHVAVRPGDRIEKGDTLLVIEAMKMENEFKAGTSGTVAEVRVEAGQPVNAGDVLVVIR